MQATARGLAQVQIDHGIEITVQEYVGTLNFGLMEVVHEWAGGMVTLSNPQVVDQHNRIVSSVWFLLRERAHD